MVVAVPIGDVVFCHRPVDLANHILNIRPKCRYALEIRLNLGNISRFKYRAALRSFIDGWWRLWRHRICSSATSVAQFPLLWLCFFNLGWIYLGIRLFLFDFWHFTWKISLLGLVFASRLRPVWWWTHLCLECFKRKWLIHSTWLSVASAILSRGWQHWHWHIGGNHRLIQAYFLLLYVLRMLLRHVIISVTAPSMNSLVQLHLVVVVSLRWRHTLRIVVFFFVFYHFLEFLQSRRVNQFNLIFRLKKFC